MKTPRERQEQSNENTRALEEVDYTSLINNILSDSYKYNDLQKEFLYQFLNERNKKSVVGCITADDNLKAFALVHITDYDPFGEQKEPYVIDYIYTYPKFRRTGVASSLLDIIINIRKYECTSFCNNDISINLFKNSGFKEFGSGVMRWCNSDRS